MDELATISRAEGATFLLQPSQNLRFLQIWAGLTMHRLDPSPEGAFGLVFSPVLHAFHDVTIF